MDKYEEPHSEWVHEAAHDTLVLYLPGYGKENLKVHVTSTGKVRISGERPVGENEVIHFRKEFPILANYDADRISASFKDGILRLKLPKLIGQVEPQQEEKPKPVPSTEAPKPDQKPTNGEANQVDQKQAAQKVPSKKDTDKQTSEQVEAKMPQKHEDVQQNQKNDQGHVADKEVSPRTNMEKPKIEKTGDGVAKTLNDASSKAAEKEKEINDRIGKTDYEKPKEKVPGGVTGMVKEKIEQQIGVTRQVLGVLVTQIRNPRRAMNLVLALLLVVVLGLYARNAFRFLLGGSDSKD